MGTRGIYGIRKNGVDKFSYNHFDSDPDYLGLHIAKFCSEESVSALNDLYDHIEMVDSEGKPDDTEVQAVNAFLNIREREADKTTWYDLLRLFQGDMGLLCDFMKANNGVAYMEDAGDFIKDSLFCEYGYIINLDDNKLEFWEGFQKEPDLNNRYGTDVSEYNQKYYPCRLVKKFSLFSLTNKKTSPEMAVFKMNWNCKNERAKRTAVKAFMKDNDWYIELDGKNNWAKLGKNNNESMTFAVEFDGSAYCLIRNIINELKGFDADNFANELIESVVDRDIESIRDACNAAESLKGECMELADKAEQLNV